MFAPASDWKPPALSDLPSWRGQKYVGFDTEANNPNLRKMGIAVRRGGFMCGYSFAFEDGRKWYIPLRHQGGGNVDCEQGLRYLRDQAASFQGELVGIQLQFDIDYANAEGAFFKKVEFFRDVGVLDAIIYELHNNYNLDAICKRLGLPMKKEELLREAALCHGFDPKADIWKLHSKYVGPYGCDDALLPIRVLQAHQRTVDAFGLQNCWDIESRLLPVLLRMRQRGVLLDFDQLDRVNTMQRELEKEKLAFIKHHTGVDIGVGNTNKKELLALALNEVGIFPRKNDKGQYIINKALASHENPVVRSIFEAKSAAKVQEFVGRMHRFAVNGRIHTTFIQSVGGGGKDKEGASSGRLSSRFDNLQQQPSEDWWRAVFLPEPGSMWGCLDFSQQEPRMTTALAARHGCTGAKEAALEYQRNPKVDNHTFMAQLTGLDRKYAKALFLGLCYGQGGAKLCRTLGLPTRWAIALKVHGKTVNVVYKETRREALKFRKEYEGEVYMWEAAGLEGQAIIDQFNRRAPYISEFSRAASEKVRKTGTLKLLCGRILHFPMKETGEYDWVHKAGNRVIQPNCGYMTKQAMIDIDREMPNLFLQIQNHDEVDASFETIKQMKQCAELMSNAIPGLAVPFRVDIEVGPNWGHLNKVCGSGNCERFIDNKIDDFYCRDHAA